MALLTAQNISRDTTGGGLQPAYTAVTASDTFAADSETFLHVKNGSGASITVTIPIPTGRDPIPNTPYAQNRQYAVPAGQERMFGPFPASYYGDPVTGLVTVNYSATATVTAALLNLQIP